MIALVRTRAPFAQIEDEPYRLLQWIEFFPEQSFIWLTQTPDKIYKRFGRENFPAALQTYDMTEYYKANTFSEKRKILDSIIKEKGITEVVTLQNDLKLGFSKGKEDSFKKFFDGFIEKDVMTTFQSIKLFLNNSFIAYHLTEKLPHQHIYVDPQEGLWHKVHGLDNHKGRYIFYHNDRIGAEYLPFIEWTSMKDLNLNRNNKSRDFVFGFTVKTDDRVPLYEELMKIKTDKMDFLVQYPKKKIRTAVNRDKYFELISASKFTLIIPSYEIIDFSSIRFWESIVRGCIPFVLDSCNWEQGFIEFPEIGKIVGEELVVKKEDLEKKIKETDYYDLINRITATNDWKKLQSPEWYIEKSRVMASRFTDTDKPHIVKTNVLF